MAAESTNNWEVLLPLRRLRRLTLPQRAVHDQLATATLSQIPWVWHVFYWGRTCGERAHLSTEAWRVHTWLHQLGRVQQIIDWGGLPPERFYSGQ